MPTSGWSGHGGGGPKGFGSEILSPSRVPPQRGCSRGPSPSRASLLLGVWSTPPDPLGPAWAPSSRKPCGLGRSRGWRSLRPGPQLIGTGPESHPWGSRGLCKPLVTQVQALWPSQHTGAHRGTCAVPAQRAYEGSSLTTALTQARAHPGRGHGLRATRGPKLPTTQTHTPHTGHKQALCPLPPPALRNAAWAGQLRDSCSRSFSASLPLPSLLRAAPPPPFLPTHSPLIRNARRAIWGKFLPERHFPPSRGGSLEWGKEIGSAVGRRASRGAGSRA